MRCLKLLLVGGLVLALSGATYGLTSNASRLTHICGDIRLSVNFAGFEIRYDDGVSGLYDPVTGLTLAPLGTGAAVGYVPVALAPVGSGGLFVLYDSTGTVVADVNALGANTPGVANLGGILQANTFTAFGVGTIDNVQNPDGTVVALPQTRPGGPGDTYQLTFTVKNLPLSFVPVVNPGTGSYDTGFDVPSGLGTGTLLTTFLEGGIFQIVEDKSTDAYGSPIGIPATATSPAGELPTAYLDPLGICTADYYEPAALGGRSQFAFNTLGLGAEPVDELLVLALTHIGGLKGTDSFYADLRGLGPLPGGYVTAGPAVNHPVLGPLTLWSGGRTTFHDIATSLGITGGAWIDWGILDPLVGFRMTSDVAFGLWQTGDGSPWTGPGPGLDPGTLPELANTFTFQTPEGGGPEIFGGHVVIPEPVTMAGLLLGLGGLVRYTRRRRLV